MHLTFTVFTEHYIKVFYSVNLLKHIDINIGLFNPTIHGIIILLP